MSWSVRKEKNGMWKGYVELPRYANGKRHRKKTKQFARKRDAENAAKELENMFLKGAVNPNYSDWLVADICQKFLANTSAQNKSQSTIDNYKKNIKNHIIPTFGEYSIKALNYENLQNYINEFAENGYKYSTISSIKGVLSVVLDYAKKLKCINENPMDEVEIPEFSKNNKGLTTQKGNTYIPKENIEKLFERFPEGNPNFIPLILGYKCGCRDGEAYAVTWDDIDFEEATLDINKQLQYIDKRWQLVSPKYSSHRKIGLDKETVEIFKREKERQDAEKENDKYYITVFENNGVINYDEGNPVDFVIKLEHGDFKSPNTRQHIADVAHHELNIDYTYHSLRHTHATILAEEGYSPYDVMLRLGHKNINVTLKYYLHNTDGTRKASQPKLEEIMAKTAAKRLRNIS